MDKEDRGVMCPGGEEERKGEEESEREIKCFKLTLVFDCGRDTKWFCRIAAERDQSCVSITSLLSLNNFQVLIWIFVQ